MIGEDIIDANEDIIVHVLTLCYNKVCVGTKGVSQLYHLSFDDNKVLKIFNWILLKVYSSVQDL